MNAIWNAICLGLPCGVEVPLINGSQPVPDGNFNASTIYGVGWEPYQARLHNTAGQGGWTADLTERNAAVPSMWIQVI